MNSEKYDTACPQSWPKMMIKTGMNAIKKYIWYSFFGVISPNPIDDEVTMKKYRIWCVDRTFSGSVQRYAQYL